MWLIWTAENEDAELLARKVFTRSRKTGLVSTFVAVISEEIGSKLSPDFLPLIKARTGSGLVLRLK